MQEAKEIQPIKKRRKLTAKQQGFVKDFLETKNASEAVRRNYLPDNPNLSDNSIAVIGSQNLRKFNIQEAIEDLRAIMAQDSYLMYGKQKEILDKTIKDDNLELANKIINKVIDRAGLVPVYKTQSTSTTLKFNFRRGIKQEPTQVSPQENTSALEANNPDVA